MGFLLLIRDDLDRQIMAGNRGAFLHLAPYTTEEVKKEMGITPGACLCSLFGYDVTPNWELACTQSKLLRSDFVKKKPWLMRFKEWTAG